MSDRDLLTAKLHVPKLRNDYILRLHLVARLDEEVFKKLTILSTPAGFGKTTLLCEWLKEKIE